MVSGLFYTIEYFIQGPTYKGEVFDIFKFAKIFVGFLLIIFTIIVRVEVLNNKSFENRYNIMIDKIEYVKGLEFKDPTLIRKTITEMHEINLEIIESKNKKYELLKF